MRRSALGSRSPAICSIGEAVKRHVGVEGVDHPFPITPGERPREIVDAAFAVGIAGQVQPVTRPLLAIVRRGEQLIDEALVCALALVGEESFRLFGRGRQAGQVEIQPAQQGALVRFG